MKLLRTVVGLSVAAALSATAYAQTGKSESKVSSFSDRFNISYTGYYYGSPLNEPMASMQPGGESKTFLQNGFSFGYKMDSGWNGYAAWRFGTEFVRGFNYVADEARIGFKKSGTLAQAGPVKLSFLRFDAELPTTQVSQDQNLIVAPGMLAVTSAPLGGRWGSELWLSTRAYIRSETAKNTSFYSYVGPNLSYTFNDNLVLKNWLEVEWVHAGETSGLANASVALRPSLEWAVTKRLDFAPYVAYNLKSGGAENTQLGFELAAKILN